MIKYNKNENIILYFTIFTFPLFTFYFSQCIVLFKCKDKKLVSCRSPTNKTMRKNKIQLMLAAVTQQDGGEIL